MRRIAFAGTEARRSHIVYPGRNMSIALQCACWRYEGHSVDLPGEPR